ncbi:MAG TPA: ATP-binding protein [Candidatus Sulfomarinibacteraceae bacterium]|nr:ATP-binding protein [Candidatus Sulfomarinibacteraceae bacterium]
MTALSRRLQTWFYDVILSVPVRVKITGIVLLPVLILGMALNYWVTMGLSDWLSYLLTDERVVAAMAAGSRSVILVTLLASAGSIALAFFLTHILVQPLLALRTMAQQVAAGQLDARAPVWSNDEIGEVATAVNSMTDHLVQTQEDLTRSNRRLAAMNRIILAADRENEIHDVLYAVLESTLDVMGLEAGWVYLRDPERDSFHLASWYNVPEQLQPFLLQEDGAWTCQCQQELKAGRLPEEGRVRRCARLDGLHSVSGDRLRHITLPIEVREEQFGVMNLLCNGGDAFSDDDVDLLQAIGTQVSEIVANAWLRLKLAEKEMARQALLESLVNAQEEERHRLARELHDGAGQMLTNLLVRIKTLEKRAPSAELSEGLNEVLDTMAQTIEHVRDLSYRLRPAALEEFGLAVAIQTLVEEMAAEAGLSADCAIAVDENALLPGVEVTLYRIAQEALTNVVRHAGASHVDVSISPWRKGIMMRIEDDGCGFSVHQVHAARGDGRRHLGLISMQERAEIIGGAFDVYTAPGEGTSVVVWAPLHEEKENAG